MNERAYASSSEFGDKYSYIESPYMMSGHQNNLMLQSNPHLSKHQRHQSETDPPSSSSLNSNNNNILGVPNEPTSLSPLHQLRVTER